MRQFLVSFFSILMDESCLILLGLYCNILEHLVYFRIKLPECIVFDSICIKESTFGVWTGSFACPSEKIALLCCLATGRYHSSCSYQMIPFSPMITMQLHLLLLVGPIPVC